MQALVITGPGTIQLQEVAEPEAKGECLVRVLTAGICGTDLQLLQGYAGFRGIPGHEFVGIVESAPPADARWIGKRVVGDINVGCGRCEWCERGVREHCTSRTVVGIRERDGAFAELLTLPAGNLHEIPPVLDDHAAVFVEPVAAACRILEQVDIGARARIAVLGDGRMGLLTAQVIRTVAPDVTVFGRHTHKLAIAKQLELPSARAEDAPHAGNRFDVVVDATGRPDGLRLALELVRPRGTIVVKSTFHGEAPIQSWPIVVNEVTIVGSRCGPFGRAIEALTSGTVKVAPLISQVAWLDEYQAAFTAARSGLKVLLTPRRSGGLQTGDKAPPTPA
jgi:threonine dehydrogenase-like Zn-dependent dehydrogenase